jgi:Haemolysin-III related
MQRPPSYHGLPAGRVKRFFMKVDYCAIYLFIAGSYAPFALGVLSGHGGTALLVVIWTLAAASIALQVIGFRVAGLRLASWRHDRRSAFESTLWIECAHDCHTFALQCESSAACASTQPGNFADFPLAKSR